MAVIVKFFSVSIVIFCLLNGALAECSLSNIAVSQSVTGSSIQGKTEYEVVVSNNCICSHSSLMLSCEGFQTTESVDPSIFQAQGNHCSINDGQPIFQGSPIKFEYAWDNKFDLSPVSSQINCS